MESVGSGTSRSGSISCWAPSPVQRGQAPCGELKEKIRGSSSGSETPCSGHAKFSLKSNDSPSTTSIATRPSASCAAVSIDCASRVRKSGFITSRSTTTSIVCLNFLSSSGASSSRYVSPSTFTREKPSARSSSKTSLYSPLREPEHLVDDRLQALPRDRPDADRAVRVADPRVEQAQVVVDLRDRADGGAWVPRGRLLVDRDRRAQAVDRVDVRLLHHLEELARVGGEALDVPPLTLGVDRVEGKRRLPGPGEPGDADERVPRQPDGDVLQVVLARAVDYQFLGGHSGDHSIERTDVPLVLPRRREALSGPAPRL